MGPMFRDFFSESDPLEGHIPVCLKYVSNPLPHHIPVVRDTVRYSYSTVSVLKGVLHPCALILKTLCIFSKNKATFDIKYLIDIS